METLIKAALTSNTSCLSGTRASSADLLGSGADLAFVVYAMQIQQLDGFIRQSLDEVQGLQTLRGAINDQLAKLREMRTMIVNAEHAEGDGEAKRARLELHPPPTRVDLELSLDGTVKTTTGCLLGPRVDQKDPAGNPVDCYDVSVASVDKEINRLTGIAQGLDSDREIKMIMMNSYLNKKEQAVTQLTNFIKKAHDVSSAIINNLK